MEEETESGGGGEKEGAPAWVMTFADLMSLLMVFFVLLLSFSEMDVQKYKQVAGSLAQAFGVQRMIKAEDIPKGTSIIAQEFSPGKPEATIVDDVRQQTTDELKDNIVFHDPAIDDAEAKKKELEKELWKEVSEGLLEINTVQDQVVIRIREKGSFPSGAARVGPDFLRVILKISAALKKVKGRILVAGHTDDIPIQTVEFPSNWVLSAARAAAVVHTMTERGGLARKRVEIRAHADNQPLAEGRSAEIRARNRRVEIILLGDRSARKVLDEVSQPEPADNG